MKPEIEEVQKIPLIVILGPTTSGKSALGILLAKKFHGEIISADSRQVYRGLDLGTGKVTKKEQREVSHHLLDCKKPGSHMNIAQYKKNAESAIKKILRKGKVPLLVGGSALYINSLIYNYEIPPIAATSFRKRLEKKSLTFLLKKLQKADSITYYRIDRANKRRVVRALEVCMTTGRPFSAFQKKNPSKYHLLVLGLNPKKREDLYYCIDKRIDERIKKGMIAEVRNLLMRGVSKNWLKKLGLEYKFITEYLDGIQTKKRKIEMIERLKYASHDFARHQLTWFRRNNDIHWVKGEQEANKLIKKFLYVK